MLRPPESSPIDLEKVIVHPFMENPGSGIRSLEITPVDRIITEQIAPEKMYLTVAGGIIFNTIPEWIIIPWIRIAPNQAKRMPGP